MNDLINTNKRLKTAHDNRERDYDAHIKKLDDSESKLTKRMDELNKKKREVAKSNGNLEACHDDLVEINAGGKVIAAKRSTLTQLEGTRLEALFSGRWDKKLQRDGNGRIFLDVNADCFQAIVDYLNELTISSEDNPPAFPSVDDDHQHILQHQLELFGLVDQMSMVFPASNIVKDGTKAAQLCDWLQEDGSNGELHLLYQSSRDGRNDSIFHSKCDNKGSTLTIIETDDGLVVGGYSNTPWASNERWALANKAFLFALSGSGISSPCKMKLKNPNNTNAICNASSYGPRFGGGNDLQVAGQNIYLRLGNSYEHVPYQQLTSRAYHTIKEMEVFQVVSKPSTDSITTPAKKKAQHEKSKIKPITRFSRDINDALNAKEECLFQAKLEMNHLEESFKDEEAFTNNFACGDIKDVVVLNVSGTMMVTKRATLCVAEESVLAQQFDDNKWTEQGCNTARVKEWTPQDVTSWVSKIDGIPVGIANIFKENEITGRELLTLKKDGLLMLGITRTGTVCLLSEEIESLKRSSQDIATLIEHSPYCFGKILDYLRLKHLHSQGLVDEPSLPTVCDTQKSRFEKVVKYYFPGIGGLGGGSALNDAVLQAIKTMGAFNDAGAHVNQITEVVTPQGYSADDIKMAINNLSNEGHIYSTVDEYNYQYAAE